MGSGLIFLFESCGEERVKKKNETRPHFPWR